MRRLVYVCQACSPGHASLSHPRNTVEAEPTSCMRAWCAWQPVQDLAEEDALEHMSPQLQQPQSQQGSTHTHELHRTTCTPPHTTPCFTQ